VSDEEASADSESPVHDWNDNVIAEFRANEGRLSGQFAGAPMLLLRTKGAKSGRERVNPMMYLDYEGRTFVFASKAGADTNPDWYHNLVANPLVMVELGADIFEATATALQGEERDRVYAVQAERYPGFAEYESKTTRQIPVVELVRAQ
jgi:deazaflavin-dependent oxidoreductase (nitroreductase family)